MSNQAELLQEAVACIREIADPIKFMRDRLNDGEQLNGGYAISLSNDPEFLKKIARTFLAKIDAAESVAEGFVMVPATPSNAMLDAGFDAQPEAGRDSLLCAWEAMLAASGRQDGAR